MTDSEIIKAFECCYFGKDICEECPYFKENCASLASYEIPTQILDLINRQKAEIERLKEENNLFADVGKMYSEIKTEAIKEFAERLKTDFENPQRGRNEGVINA